MSTEADEVFPPFDVPMVAEKMGDALNGHDARLILDLVANLRKPSEVLASYGITAEEFAAKANNPIFRNAYQEANKIWSSNVNIRERIRLKAAYMLEDSLLSLFNIIRQEGIGVNAKLEAIEKLTKISTVVNVPKEGAQGTAHNISINFGGAQPVKIVSETPDGHHEITALPAQ